MKNRIAILFLLMVMTNITFAGTKMQVVKFDVTPSDWVHQNPDILSLTFKYEDKNLTQDAFDNGTVMLYVLGTGGGGWWPLPHAYPSNASKEGASVSYNYLPGHIEIRFNGKPGTTYHYKMVILSQEK